MRRVGRLLALVVVIALAVTATSCASDAPTTELANDPGDVTVPGPVPTAPTTVVGEGLSESGSALIAELEALSNETDLCAVLSGDALNGLLSQEFDIAGLVTTPAGITQLVVLVDATFEQLAAIAPPEVQPSMQVVHDVWTRVSSLNAGGADAQARTAEILAEPQVLAANQAIITWAAVNCGAVEDLLGGL
jgi:hypothetical protein